MATFEGREKTLVDAVRSIAPQVDTLHIWVNNYPKVKRFELGWLLSCHNNVVITYSDVLAKGEDGNIGDIGKFWNLDSWDGYVLTVDDSWIYPPDYVEVMLDAVDRYNRKSIITAHGRVITGEIKSYYFYKASKLFLYNDVETDTPCNEFGTGVMALHSDLLTPAWFDLTTFKHTNMTDIYMSIAANEAFIPAFTVKHSSGWIRPSINSTGLRRISSVCSRNEKLQVDTCNSHNWTLIEP
jgi:hypothetical protein